MYWRLHLASHLIRSTFILPDDQDQLAVSDSLQKVRFYDLASGAHYGDLMIDPDLLDNDIPEERRELLEGLKAPNGAYLPCVDFGTSHLYVSEDGKLRLIHDLNAGLTLEIDDQSIPLDVGHKRSVLLTALDRELGTIAALADDHYLHLFQQQIRINSLPLDTKARIRRLFVITGGSRVLVAEETCLKLLDTTGKVQRSQELHYTLGPVAMSPDGSWLMVGDADHQLLRLYNRDLILVRQQHAVDLLSRAKQVQLFVDTPAEAAPLVTLDITNDGLFCFAMAGIVCVAHIELMTELPQPRLLL